MDDSESSLHVKCIEENYSLYSSPRITCVFYNESKCLSSEMCNGRSPTTQLLSSTSATAPAYLPNVSSSVP